MDIFKRAPKPDNSPEQPNKERRSFMCKVGAGISAVLAFAVPGMSKPGIDREAELKTRVDQLSNQLGILEDENAIRELHKAYETCLNNGRYEDVVNLFAHNGEVIFNGGFFKGKEEGVRRLYLEHFSPGLTGKRIDPAPGFLPNTEDRQDMIKVATDRKSAEAQFCYSMQVGVPMLSDWPLVKMARLHGQGIKKWWEGGVYDVSYVKDMKDGTWKIERLEHRVLSQADYRPGKSYARPISVPLFSKIYPEDPVGPDRLITIT